MVSRYCSVIKLLGFKNIRNYWVSALTFRHPDFDHKGTTPIIPIAFLLHTNRSAGSHEALFIVLMKKPPSTIHLEMCF